MAARPYSTTTPVPSSTEPMRRRKRRRSANSASRTGPCRAGIETRRPPEVCGSYAERDEGLWNALQRQMPPGEVAVPRVTARANPLPREIERPVDRREALGLEQDLDTAPLGHLVNMTEEPEPRNVRDGVHVLRPEHVRRVLVQRLHPADRALELLGSDRPVLVPGHDQPGAERLRHVERVTRLRGVLPPDPVGMDAADHRQPVLRLRVPNRVPAGEQRAR